MSSMSLLFLYCMYLLFNTLNLELDPEIALIILPRGSTPLSSQSELQSDFISFAVQKSFPGGCSGTLGSIHGPQYGDSPSEAHPTSGQQSQQR